jgi:O-antigen/teichoic acid export membrane protein
LASETVFGLRAVALSIPFTLVAAGAMGSLEGLQEFRRVSTRRAMLSVAQFGLPTVVALWRPDVGWAIAALALSRAAGVVVWLRLLRRSVPRVPGAAIDSADFRHLLRFGGWLSVSNIVGPLMVYADRFYLASLFPAATLATYTVPYDALLRVMSLPMTAIGAVFPALAEAQARQEDSARLLSAVMSALFALLLPPLLIAMVFAKPLLSLWLGHQFALLTMPVFQILLVGVFANGTAHVPYALLQAHGRADLTAKLHLAELPVFVGSLLWAVSLWGVVGAAVAWTLRVVLDALLLYGWGMWLQPAQRVVLAKGLFWAVLAALVLCVPLVSQRPLLVLPPTLVALIFCGAILSKLYLRWHRDTFTTSVP